MASQGSGAAMDHPPGLDSARVIAAMSNDTMAQMDAERVALQQGMTNPANFAQTLGIAGSLISKVTEVITQMCPWVRGMVHNMGERIGLCEQRIFEQNSMQQSIVAEAKDTFDKVREAQNNASTQMKDMEAQVSAHVTTLQGIMSRADSQMQDTRSKIEGMQGQIQDKVKDIDNKIAASEVRDQQAAQGITSMQDALTAVKQEYDGLCAQLNMRLGSLDEQRIKTDHGG